MTFFLKFLSYHLLLRKHQPRRPTIASPLLHNQKRHGGPTTIHILHDGGTAHAPAIPPSLLRADAGRGVQHNGRALEDIGHGLERGVGVVAGGESRPAHLGRDVGLDEVEEAVVGEEEFTGIELGAEGGEEGGEELLDGGHEGFGQQAAENYFLLDRVSGLVVGVLLLVAGGVSCGKPGIGIGFFDAVGDLHEKRLE